MPAEILCENPAVVAVRQKIKRRLERESDAKQPPRSDPDEPGPLRSYSPEPAASPARGAMEAERAPHLT